MAAQKKPRNHIYNIIVILVLLSIIAVAFFAFFPVDSILSSIVSSEEKTEMLELPTILTQVPSQATGEKHQLTVTIALELDSGSVKDTDPNSISASLKPILETVDYDTLVSEGDTSYITNAVEAYIEKMVPENSLHGVYVTKLVTDFNMPGYEPAESSPAGDSNKIQNFINNVKN